MRQSTAGFSLVELVAIIILASIVMVTAYARLDINGFRRAAFVQELKAAIRFAHKFSITSACDVQVVINAASNSYAINLRSDAVASPSNCLGASGAFTVSLKNPAVNGSYAGTAPGGVDITTGLTWYFDRQGRPSSNGTITIDGTTVVIEPDTGLVY